MFFRSIRFRMLIWYIFFLAVTLFFFSLAIYGSFDKALYDDFDDLLYSRADGVADAVHTYWHTAGFANHDDFVRVASGWVEEKRKDPELMSLFVRILNTKGDALVSSKTAPKLEAMPADDFGDILGGEDSFDTFRGESPEGKSLKFRVYTRPVREEGRVEYIVQTGGPMGLLSIALGNLRLALFIILPLTIILAGIPGVLLVTLTLRPVDNMVNTIKQITAENLKLKIHMPDTKDEIKRLADTFNDMISRLDRSFSSQQKFIQNISRELQGPVNSLKDELESALAGKLTEAEYKALLVRALKASDGFSRTIEDLSILSQFGDERPTLEIRNINLTSLVEQLFNEMSSSAEEKGISASLSCAGTVKIDGDREKLIQLVTNLLDNAVRYTHRKGSIKVAVRRSGEKVQIIISDTGIGIPEDELPYIFDRFYQVVKPRGVKGGFGLGLSAVKAIVEAHRGDIGVESTEGRGSVFTVNLPLNYSG